MQRTWLEFFWKMDWVLFGSLLTLTAIGLLMIYGIGVSSADVSLLPFRKQALAFCIGLVLFFLFALLDYRQLRSISPLIYLVGLALLVGVLFFGVTIRGTQGWFRFGSFGIQPVELAKVCFALFLAAYFSRHLHRRLTWISFFGSFFALVIYLIPVLLQPDFGSGMVLVAIWFSGVAIAGLRFRAWAFLIFICFLVVGLLWQFGFEPYQKARLTSFLNPQADPLGAGYNVIQAQTAIGSGGWFGKGIGEGSQSRLRFIPEASTDFMFAVIGEELGFIGLALILGLFGVLLSRIIWIGFRSGDSFAGAYAVMLAGLFGMHLLVNAGMNMGIMPVTGIPLPFASAAASSLVAGYAALGIIQSISIRLS